MMNIYIKNIAKQYNQLLTELEKYGYYCLRCLHRCNIPVQPSDFAYLTFLRDNGQIAEALVYPATAVKETSIENPMFFYGFKANYNFSNLDYPIEIIFSESYEELKK